MIIKSLVKILTSMDGVKIINVQDTNEYPHISLTITSSQSRLLLIYCAEAANISLNIYASLRPTSVKALEYPNLGIEYQYRAEYIDEFQNLGAFIVWNLYDLGQIEKIIADEYLLIFKAINIDEREKNKLLRDING